MGHAMRRTMTLDPSLHSTISRISSKVLSPGESGCSGFLLLLRPKKSTNDEQTRAAWHEKQIQELGTFGGGGHVICNKFLYFLSVKIAKA